MEDVNKRWRVSLSLSKLECSPQEINSREIRLYLTFSANWNERGKVWKKREFILTLSLPECLGGLCKVTLTFYSADEILWSDHSNESSLLVLSHGAICFSKFHKMKFGNLVEICFWFNLAVKGLKVTFSLPSPSSMLKLPKITFTTLYRCLWFQVRLESAHIAFDLPFAAIRVLWWALLGGTRNGWVEDLKSTGLIAIVSA